MNGGTKFLACSAMLVVAACVGDGGKLEIRSLPTPLAQGKKPVSFRVAEGHQQMAMNNVALALESYRNALREDPNSVDGHAGIAAAYDRMGRYDLAHRSYQAALAIEPGNTTVLAMLAASLDQQGKVAAATAVRLEIKQRLAASVAPVQDQVAALDSAGTANVAPPADLVPAPAMPLPVAAAEAAIPAPDLAAALPVLASAPLAVAWGTIAPAAVAAVFAPDEPARRATVAATPPPAPATTAPVALAQTSAPARAVTVKLPPARPVAAPTKPAAAPAPAGPIRIAEASPAQVSSTAATKPAPLQPAAPTQTSSVALAAAHKAARPPAAQAVVTGRGPRLERTSLGEVALLTNRAPQWAPLVVKQDQRSATVRFVPLKQANVRFASVKLLNAARVHGLAARTRSTLFDRGWRSMAIGDAAAIRARSLVLYPAHRRTTALSLARQFGFETAQRAGGKDITVLLGRDATMLMRRSPAG